MLTHLNLARGYRGGERQTELLVRGLADLGWTQRLVARRDEPLAERCRDVPRLDIRTTAAGVPGAFLALRGASLVHSHEGRGVQAAWLNQRLRGVPYVITRRVQNGPRHTRFNRVAYGAAAGLVAISGAIRAALQGLDPSLDPRVIPSAGSGFTAGPGTRERLRGELCAVHAFLVGHVGALVDSHKGQLALIELARRLAGPAPDVGFVLVGGGADEARLRQAAAGLPNLRFTGEVGNVGDHLAAFDLFIYPSRHEGLGSILLDALAAGLPIVASAVGGIPEIVADGENGLLCPPGDVDALERAVLALRADPALRARMASANREKARQFTAAAMTARYAALYRDLATARGIPLPLP